MTFQEKLQQLRKRSSAVLQRANDTNILRSKSKMQAIVFHICDFFHMVIYKKCD